MRIALVDNSFHRSHETIAHSFVFDEAFHLSTKGVNVYIVRSKIEEHSFSYGIHFHVEREIKVRARDLLLRNLRVYPRFLFSENLQQFTGKTGML